MKEYGIDKIIYKIVVDSLELYFLIYFLEIYWIFNFKVGFVRFGFFMFRCDIIFVKGYFLVFFRFCCDVCCVDKWFNDLIFIFEFCFGLSG